MRIWSVHPKYLDAKGLVALWRETLLAKNVLEGNTKGYKNHPQLERFKKSIQPIPSINTYLKSVWLEANRRGYNFDKQKFEDFECVEQIHVTIDQVQFEKSHLLNKLKVRDQKKYKEVVEVVNFEVHPLFKLIEGEIEPWEKI